MQLDARSNNSASYTLLKSHISTASSASLSWSQQESHAQEVGVALQAIFF